MPFVGDSGGGRRRRSPFLTPHDWEQRTVSTVDGSLRKPISALAGVLGAETSAAVAFNNGSRGKWSASSRLSSTNVLFPAS